MFGAILKSEFYKKCKTAVKTTLKRIELIKRKRKAMEKFLKNDIVDLLKNGLDINAYGRAEGLLVELNMSACYNFIADFCACLLDHVDLMDQHRECPKECREAVPSLMYAAARFADLPELRKLRSIFLKKYGSALEDYANHKFIERLKGLPPTKEMKIQFLQKKAIKSGKSWDSKALEQKLYNPPPSDQVTVKALSEDTSYENHMIPKNKDEKPVKKIDKKNADDKTRKIFPSPRRRKTDKHRYKVRENAIYEVDSENVVTSFDRNEHKIELYSECYEHKAELDEKKRFKNKFAPPNTPHNKRSSGVGKSEPQEIENNKKNVGDFENVPNKSITGKSSNQNEHRNKARSGKNLQGRKTDESKNYQRKFAPVSYQENSEKISGRDIRMAKFDKNSNANKSDPKRNEQKEEPDEKKQLESKLVHQHDDSAEKAKPKPRPVRLARSRLVKSRRFTTPLDDDNVTKTDDVFDAISQEMVPKPGHKSINDQKEEAEKEINELLIRYCKRAYPCRGKGSQFRGRDSPRARRASFGNKLTREEKKIDPGRASSYEPDRKGIHPKLPTYDEFLTRLAVLRGE